MILQGHVRQQTTDKFLRGSNISIPSSPVAYGRHTSSNHSNHFHESRWTCSFIRIDPPQIKACNSVV